MRGHAGGGGGGCAGPAFGPAPFLLGGGGRGSKRSAPLFPGPQGGPAHGLHPRFVVAEIWADKGCGGGGGGALVKAPEEKWGKMGKAPEEKWGKMGENGGKWGKMGRKWGGNAEEMGGKGTGCTTQVSLFSAISPHFPPFPPHFPPFSPVFPHFPPFFLAMGTLWVRLWVQYPPPEPGTSEPCKYPKPMMQARGNMGIPGAAQYPQPQMAPQVPMYPMHNTPMKQQATPAMISQPREAHRGPHPGPCGERTD